MKQEVQFSELEPFAHLLQANRSVYTIAYALRGPDMKDLEAPGLKSITTDVLRYFVGASPGGGLLRTPDEAQSLWESWTPEQQVWIRRLWRNSPHFRHLMVCALNVLVHVGGRQDAQKYRDFLSKELKP